MAKKVTFRMKITNMLAKIWVGALYVVRNLTAKTNRFSEVNSMRISRVVDTSHSQCSNLGMNAADQLPLSCQWRVYAFPAGAPKLLTLKPSSRPVAGDVWVRSASSYKRTRTFLNRKPMYRSTKMSNYQPGTDTALFEFTKSIQVLTALRRTLYSPPDEGYMYVRYR